LCYFPARSGSVIGKLRDGLCCNCGGAVHPERSNGFATTATLRGIRKFTVSLSFSTRHGLSERQNYCDDNTVTNTCIYIYMDTRTHIQGSIRFLEKLQGIAICANNKFSSNISFRVPRVLYFLYIDFAELRRSRNFIVFSNGRILAFNEIRKP